MGRPPDPTLRDALVHATVDYVLARPLAELSLRPLAAAVGSSPRTLLYHFGSKADLVAAVLVEIGLRQRRLIDGWVARAAEHDTRTLLLGAWQWLVAPRHDRLLRVLFEAYGVALRERRTHGAFLRASSDDWTAPFARALEREGFSRERSTTLATLVVAVIRGLVLDLLATADRPRIDRAFRSFVAAIELPARRLPGEPTPPTS